MYLQRQSDIIVLLKDFLVFPLRWFVALTPIAGTLAFPLLVPLVTIRFGLSAGVAAAVSVGTLWFVIMLRTAEMPH